MDAQGEVVAQRAGEAGASKLKGGAEAFEAALRGLVGDWLAASTGIPVVACGMVGSKHGWAEASYVSAPAPLSELAAHLRSVVTASGLRAHIIPGLSWEPANGAPEVMRGEETQVAALLAAQPELAAGCCIVLPGTHSKWVRMHQSVVQSFDTYMTGELFEVLLCHSVLGRTARLGGPLDRSAFERGVAAAQAHGGADLARLLFGVRTLGLFEQMSGQSLADYTSGLLIGSEIVSAARQGLGSDDRPIRLVGANSLVERYLIAFGLCGRDAKAAAVSAASGIWQIAKQAKWIR